MSSRPTFMPLASNPVPLTWDAIVFRESLLQEHPKGAIGYRLFCLRLAVWLPLQGKTKRYRGSWSSTPYFTIHPNFEVPRVPEEGRYKIVYTMRGGLELVPESDEIELNFFQDMKDCPLIRTAKRALRQSGKSRAEWIDAREQIDSEAAVALENAEQEDPGDDDGPEDQGAA